MYLDGGSRTPPITPQLAFRVAILGAVALAIFAVIFFRLWYLQVLSGDRYLAEAHNNQVRELKVQAPRGEIVDREGRVLVDNRLSRVVVIRPDRLPRRQRAKTRVYDRLARVLGMSRTEIRTRVREQLKALPFATATVKQDVSDPVVHYLQENLARFRGVDVEKVFLRSYPRHSIGAHLFGTVGEVTEGQLKDERYRGVTQGDRVGQSGIEYQYDRFLRGRNGAERLQVDALGSKKGTLREREPVAGRQLRLTIDLDVQKTGQEALGPGKGAFVAMDVDSGEIAGLGSSPSFDPNIFAKVIRQADYDRLTSDSFGAPLSNRAIQGLYPTGSTFKLVTSVAALEGGLITPDSVLHDGGSIEVGGRTFKNAGEVAYGSLALRRALQVSSDVFYYRLGLEASGGDLIQRWAAKLGLGRKTGIDLPAEEKGLVPSREWRNRGFARHQRCVERVGAAALAASPFRCGFVDRPWSAGDNVNLAVGQGDLQANPLQLAVAYAAVANGGTIVRPHLGQRIEYGDGRALQEIEAPPGRRVRIRPEFRQAILDGLKAAASAGGGTSTDVFKGFRVPVAGKTGTAEKGAGRADQSWYVALAPYPKPGPRSKQYVVATTLEAGGFGAETAAPAARRILAALFHTGDERKIVRGSSRTR